MKQVTTICDECSAPKGEANKWLKVGVLFMGGPGGLRSCNRFCASESDDFPSGAKEEGDVCGRSCAMKAFQRWMETGSIYKEQTVKEQEEAPRR